MFDGDGRDDIGIPRAAGHDLKVNHALSVGRCFAAVATHQQGELASQNDCLAEAITDEGGEWDAQRSVAALHEIGLAVDEKRARQILRDLAADGVLQHLDTDRAVYRAADDPEQ
ncbi:MULTISPECIES: hypothetical protein [unclassified Streptomyces]|uniref:hypothetical protein n=1 Tax=unclassified Streptomyces TaxID=2593676 RepID=UPI002F913BF9|nr:hypothetical protein OG832_45420 [Streptomyces sp. NBC_00826]WTB60482.1 hypothetical protein OG832_46480 [Streptomyces sp. NBC_00826]